METTINKQDDRAVVTLVGDLDTAASRKAEKDLAPVYSYTDCDILVDCAGLTYISSSGLRLLLAIYKHTRRTGHKALLAHANDEVKEVFTVSGFMQLFTIED